MAEFKTHAEQEQVKAVAKQLWHAYQIESCRHKNVFMPSGKQQEVEDLEVEFNVANSNMSKQVGQFPTRRRVDPHVENAEAPKKTKTDRRLSVLMRLAEFIIATKVDPDKFIRYQFAVLADDAPVPFLEVFLSDGAMQAYYVGQKLNRYAIRVSRDIQVNTFKIEVSDRAGSITRPTSSIQAWSDTLTDDNVKLSALFRYCMAVSIQKDSKVKDPVMFVSIADVFRTEAAIQYVRDADAYDESWQPMLPAGWRQQAEKIYSMHFGF